MFDRMKLMCLFFNYVGARLIFNKKNNFNYKITVTHCMYAFQYKLPNSSMAVNYYFALP